MMTGMRILTSFMRMARPTAYVATGLLLAQAAGTATLAEPPADQAAPKAATPKPVTCEIPGTALELRMVPVPGPDGKTAFWISDAEISWDHYDVFVYELDEPANEDVDAVTRPTRPYISADRGWGHAGYPALSISHRGANAFCKWVAASTGRPYRLPTVEEWKQVCKAAGVSAENSEEHGWLAGNAKRRTHKLRSRKPDALGLHDLHGNVSEWCRSGEGEDDFVLVGACYSDDTVECDLIKTPIPDWNDTDPQIPKSIWWLSDAPFAGFRVVCESPLPSAKSPTVQEDQRPRGGTP